jgi:hypothetical protein
MLNKLEGAGDRHYKLSNAQVKWEWRTLGMAGRYRKGGLGRGGEGRGGEGRGGEGRGGNGRGILDPFSLNKPTTPLSTHLVRRWHVALNLSLRSHCIIIPSMCPSVFN